MKLGTGQRDWEWTRKCDQCVLDVLRKKANYPKKFRKVPGLQCEGAAGSQGLDICHADRLKNFQISPLSRIFHFWHIFDSAKKTAAPTEFSPSLEAPGLKILMLGSCPEVFFFFQNEEYINSTTLLSKLNKRSKFNNSLFTLSHSSVFIV